MKKIFLTILMAAGFPAIASADQQLSCKMAGSSETVLFAFSNQNQKVSYNLDGLDYDLPFTGLMEAAMVYEDARYIPIYGQRAVTVSVPEATLQTGQGSLILDNSITANSYSCTAR
jgi:hypothetical protein